jgi:putative SOS response-associated peptidase YedK
MPVVLTPDAHDLWLDPAEKNPDELQHLLRPYEGDDMEAVPVSRSVNNPRNNSPQNLLPLDLPS